MHTEKKEQNKEITSLSTEMSSVFVVKNTKKRAFIEQFEYTSINFTQKDLGTILGFFIVRDQSSASENIVNFLASEIKKHYFAPNQKSVEEKFESTLHRINRALEELANIGNVDWLGTIDGAVCVISDTSIHFSVTGAASILLLRDNALLDISEGLASSEAAEYPLKTFVDISSGEINGGDKIIITSKELLELISLDELEKNANRMGQENFIQLIETALTNECAMASTTIIDVYEKKIIATQPLSEEPAVLPENFFSAKAFTQPEPSTAPHTPDISVADLIDHTPKEYTDPRTGHIHIHGDEVSTEKTSVLDEAREKVSDIADDTRDFLKKKIRQISKKVSRQRDDVTIFNGKDLSEIAHEGNDPVSTSHITQKLKSEARSHFRRVCVITRNAAQKTVIHCIGLLSKARELHRTSVKKDTETQGGLTYIPQKPKNTLQRFLPRFSYIKELWQSLSFQKKIVALGIVAIIVFAPLLFNIFSQPSQDTPDQENIEQAVHQEPIEQIPPETEHNTIPDPNVVYERDGLLQVTMLNDTAIAVTADAVHIITDTPSSFPLPEASRDIAFAAPMNDLNMLFILTTDDAIFTFSPLTEKFTAQNNIPTFDHANIRAMDTYLTYLYTLSNDMITRYTRIDNGFDEGRQWLEETVDLTAATDMAINEDIYIIRDTEVERYFQGEKTDYRKDPLISDPRLIYATEDTEFVWILDITHKTLYKTAKDSNAIVEQFAHNDLSQAISFSVNETIQTALITTTNSILSFELK